MPSPLRPLRPFTAARSSLVPKPYLAACFAVFTPRCLIGHWQFYSSSSSSSSSPSPLPTPPSTPPTNTKPNTTPNSTYNPSLYIPTLEETTSVRNYLEDLLKARDYPSYVLTAFIPPWARDAYLAIKSFNLDTALVADQTSNLAIGRLRMKFWRDAINAVFEGSTSGGQSVSAYKEPTVILLHNVLQGKSGIGGTSESGSKDGNGNDKGLRLNKGWFMRNISARESLLTLTPFPTINSLETYSENTYSSINYLLLESLHIHSTPIDHIAGHIGKAAGISAILRGVQFTAFPPTTTKPTPSHTQFFPGPQAAVLLPLDVCAHHGLRQEDVFRLAGNAPGLKDVVFEIATRANDHLLTARRMLKEARAEGKLGSRGDWGVLLSALPVRSFLQSLQKLDFDVFDPRLARKDWKLPFSAYWAYRRGQF